MKKLLQITVAFALALSCQFALAEVVNINTADENALAENIIGVGKKKTLAIIAFRDQHGPFKSIDELTQVKGIGLKLMNKNRDNLTVSDIMVPFVTTVAAKGETADTATK